MIEKLALITPGNFEFEPIANMPSEGIGTLNNVISWSLTMLMIGASLLCLLFLILGGIQWIASGGDKSAVESARKRITYALIGLLIVFLAFFIVRVIGDIFGIKLIRS